MSSDWRTISIGDLGRVVTGRTPPDNDPAYYGNAVPFLTPSDIKGQRFVRATGRSLSEYGARQLSRCMVPAGVGVSCIGWQMGKAVLIDRPTVTNQQFNTIIVDERIADVAFVYYSLSLRSNELFNLGAGGSRTPILNKGDFERLPFLLPPLPQQRDIAITLSLLDDKIELNQRMNETLEAMARAIFKDWFVDFGPTRAKAEGRPPYLAPDLWSLFPDRVDNNGTLEGWELSTIGVEVEVVGGSTPSTTQPSFWGGEINWATPKDLSSLRSPVLLETDRQITQAGLSGISSGLLPKGTVLLSSRAPIGYLAISETPVAINQGFIAMRCSKRLSNVYVWLWTRANLEVILQKANGSTFQEISKSNFRPIPVLVPSDPVRSAFDSLACPLYERIVANERETRTLAQTRDLLLPKLMSGEIRVREAERALETAA